MTTSFVPMDLRSVFRAIRRTAAEALSGLDLPLVAGVLAMGVIAALNLYGIGGADHTLFRRQLVLVAVAWGSWRLCRW